MELLEEVVQDRYRRGEMDRERLGLGEGALGGIVI